MKLNLAFLPLIAVAITSCSLKEELYQTRGNAVPLSFEAFFGSQDSKTCISDKDSTKILWSAEERISLFYPDADESSYFYRSSCFTSTNKDTASAVTFSGSIVRNQFFSPMEEGESTPLHYYAVYPYSTYNEFVQGALYLNVNSIQTAKESSFSDGDFPAVARTIDNRLCFHNVCGGLCFTVENPNIRSVSFTSLDSISIAGRAKVQFDKDGLPVITEITSGSPQVVVKAPNGGTFTPGVRYYMTLATDTLKTGFKLEFFTENAKADTTILKSVIVRRSTFGFLRNIDHELDFYVKAQKVVLDTNSLVIRKGESLVLPVEVLPSDASDKSVIWSSSDNSVATVSQTGEISAVQPGNCFVVATSHEDPLLSDTCFVAVKPEIDSVRVFGQVDVDVNETSQFSAVVYPEDTKYNQLKWTSSETDVATVDSFGRVCGIGEGQTVIRAESLLYPSIYDEITVTVTLVSHLEEGGSYANCYIVTTPGTYDFSPVKGVSGAALDAVASAEVMWEYVSVGITTTKPSDIISSVEIKKNRVRLTTPPVLKNGNALVAVRNSDGKILWSWHIWVQDGYDIDAESILCRNGQYLMDRHLGSVSNAPGSKRGLVYQWGRKDPFIAHSLPSPYSSTKWPSAVACSSTTGTIEYAVENPMTFIKGNSSNDWCNSGIDIWKTRWNSSSKSDYDPCPFGWKVPSGGDGGFWDTAMDTGKSRQWNYSNDGIDLQSVMQASKSCWFQATGYIDKDYVLRAFDSLVELWSSDFSKYESGACYFGAFSSNNTLVTDGSGAEYRAVGLSVRCVKEATE